MGLDLFSEETTCGSILVSDHSVFAFWVVAYGRFDCITRNHNKNKLKTVTYLYLYLEPILTNELLEFDGLGK